MKLDLVRETILSTLPGDVVVKEGFDDTVDAPTFSAESLYSNQDLNNGDVPVSNSRSIVYMHLPFERNLVGESTKWTFFLNTINLTDKMVNTFVMLMQQVSDNDTVVIHGPSFIDIHFACAIWSAIKMCRNKEITIVSPYCLTTPAAFIMTAAKWRVLSTKMFFHLTPPMVFAVGNHRDVATGKGAQMDIYERMYRELKAIGLLTNEEYQDIMTKQTSITVAGEVAFRRLIQAQPSEPVDK